MSATKNETNFENKNFISFINEYNDVASSHELRHLILNDAKLRRFVLSGTFKNTKISVRELLERINENNNKFPLSRQGTSIVRRPINIFANHRLLSKKDKASWRSQMNYIDISTSTDDDFEDHDDNSDETSSSTSSSCTPSSSPTSSLSHLPTVKKNSASAADRSKISRKNPLGKNSCIVNKRNASRKEKGCNEKVASAMRKNRSPDKFASRDYVQLNNFVKQRQQFCRANTDVNRHIPAEHCNSSGARGNQKRRYVVDHSECDQKLKRLARENLKERSEARRVEEKLRHQQKLFVERFADKRDTFTLYNRLQRVDQNLSEVLAATRFLLQRSKAVPLERMDTYALPGSVNRNSFTQYMDDKIATITSVYNEFVSELSKPIMQLQEAVNEHGRLTRQNISSSNTTRKSRLHNFNQTSPFNKYHHQFDNGTDSKFQHGVFNYEGELYNSPGHANIKSTNFNQISNDPDIFSNIMVPLWISDQQSATTMETSNDTMYNIRNLPSYSVNQNGGQQKEQQTRSTGYIVPPTSSSIREQTLDIYLKGLKVIDKFMNKSGLLNRKIGIQRGDKNALSYQTEIELEKVDVSLVDNPKLAHVVDGFVEITNVQFHEDHLSGVYNTHKYRASHNRGENGPSYVRDEVYFRREPSSVGKDIDPVNNNNMHYEIMYKRGTLRLEVDGRALYNILLNPQWRPPVDLFDDATIGRISNANMLSLNNRSTPLFRYLLHSLTHIIASIHPDINDPFYTHYGNMYYDEIRQYYEPRGILRK